MKQRIAVAITAVAVAIGTGFVGISAASAATAPSANCKAKGTSQISPGLVLTPAKAQTTKLTGSLNSCTGSGGVKSGKFTGTVKGTASCTSLLTKGSKVGSGKETVTWNNGKTTTASITITSQGKGSGLSGKFTLSGKVTAGLFKGKAIKGSFTGTPKFTGTPCTASNPLKTLTFTGTSTIS